MPRHPAADGDDAFLPFADESAVRRIGGLSIENGTLTIALHGSLDIGRDRQGLARARALKDAVDCIVAGLEAGDLPDLVAEAPAAPPKVPNPFA